MKPLLLFLFALMLVFACTNNDALESAGKQKKEAPEPNEMEGYKPSHPIKFPHDIHSGKLGIDCKYCHSPSADDKTASIPSVQICMNCHGSNDQAIGDKTDSIGGE